MQNAVLGIIVGASFVGLTMVAMQSRRIGLGTLGLQLVLGALVGALAAAVAVSIRADLIPDDLEEAIGIVAVTVAATGLILVAVRRHAQ